MAGKLKALQAWCKRQCEGYRDVSITNMTSSWKSGLAFCAIIHRYRPDLIDYDSLRKEDVYENNKLAFEVAHKHLGIPELLDAEDMVAMAVPDKLCIITYVSQYCNYFKDKDPVGGPGVKSRTPVKRPSPAQPSSPPPDTKKANADSSKAMGPTAAKRCTLDDKCYLCKQKVYVLERHMDGSRLYHRKCLREEQRSLRSPTRSNRDFFHANSGHTQLGGKQKENIAPAVGVTDSAGSSQHAAATAGPSSLSYPQNAHQSRPQTYGTNSYMATSNTKTTVDLKSANESTESGRISNASQQSSSKTSLLKMLQGSATPYKSPSSGSSAVNDRVNQFESSGNNLKWTSKTASSDPPSVSSKHEEMMEVDTTANSSSEQQHGGPVPSAARPKPQPRTSLHEKQEEQRQKQIISSAKPESSIAATNTTYSTQKSQSKVSKNDPMLSGLLLTLAKVRDEQQKAENVSARLNNEHAHTDSAKVHTDTHSTSLPHKSILKHDSPTVVSPTRSILKHSDGENTPPRKKSLSESPTRSILKGHSLDEEEHKTPRPILKHIGSGDGHPIPKERVSRTPKPILKSQDLPGDDTSLGKSDRSPSPPKSILKSHSASSREHSPESKMPKPILKSSFDEEQLHMTTSPKKSILKHHDWAEKGAADKRSEFCSSSPKSILKKSNEWEELHVAVDSEDADHSHKSILKHSPLPSSSVSHTPSKSILKVGSPPVSSYGEHLPEPPVRSALKHTERSKSPDHTLGEEVAMEIDMMAGEMHLSSGSPPGDTATGIKVASSSTTDQGCESHQSNKFSAFTLANSVDLKESKTQQIAAKQNKPIWQVELEAKQGAKQKIIYSAEKPQAKTLKAIVVTDKQVPKISASAEPTKPNKPEWQVEAEKRQAARAGKYADPEKGRLTVPVSAISIDKTRKKDSPRHRSKGSPGSTPRSSPRGSPTEARKQTESVTPGQTGDRLTLDTMPVVPSRSAPARPARPPSPRKPASYVDDSRPEWQKMAEKRRAARGGAYPDPERTPPSGAGSQGLPSYGGMDLVSMVQRQISMEQENKHNLHAPDSDNKGRVSPTTGHSTSHHPVPRPRSNKPGAESQASISSSKSSTPPDRPPPPCLKSATPSPPARPQHPPVGIPKKPEWQVEAERRQACRQNGINSAEKKKAGFPETSHVGTRKKILPETQFSFNSSDFDTLGDIGGYAEIPGNDEMPHQQRSSHVPPHSWIQERPLPCLPDCNTPKRRVNAEARLSTAEILSHLEELDYQLQQLESNGRVLEEAIRDASSEGAVETDVADEDDLMIQWFDLVNQKNELVRKESDLMYRQRQQELEDLHEELEYDLRCLMEIPENKKTASDKIREEALLQELLETVSLRNNIVDSIEEDRIRYIQEDMEIAEMMEMKGFSRRESTEIQIQEKKKTNKNGKPKDKKQKDKRNGKKKKVPTATLR